MSFLRVQYTFTLKKRFQRMIQRYDAGRNQFSNHGCSHPSIEVRRHVLQWIGCSCTQSDWTTIYFICRSILHLLLLRNCNIQFYWTTNSFIRHNLQSIVSNGMHEWISLLPFGLLRLITKWMCPSISSGQSRMINVTDDKK